MKKTAFEFGKFVAKKMAAGPAGPFGTNNGNPTALQSYGNTLDRWYNPWSKQQGLERGEEGLMRAGQGAMGVAGLAGGAALAPAAGMGGAAAFTPGSAAAYGGVVGGLAAGQAGLQGALTSRQQPPAPAPAPAAATPAPKPAAPAPAVPK